MIRLSGEGSSTTTSMSRVVISKLPRLFRRVLIERSRNAFLSLNDLFCHNSSIVEVLAINTRAGVTTIMEVARGPTRNFFC